MAILRDATIKAQKELGGDEILLFIGARQSGKTTILKQLLEHIRAHQDAVFFITLEDPEYRGLLNQSPKNLFKIFTFDLTRRSYVIIDEIQYLENPSNFLKYFFDEYKGKIKLLVSGASAFYVDRTFKDSLVGRKKIFYVYTLSFREFLRFKGENELSQKDFFSRISISEKEKVSLYYREYIIYGGYPRVVLSPVIEKEEILKDIAYSYVKKDILEAGIRQDDIFYKLMKLLAAQVGSLVNASELSSTLGVSKTAVDNYLYILRKSFHIHLLPPFYKNIRKELTKMPKVYFLDLGLRNFFVNNLGSFENRPDQGALLENAVFRQLIERYDEMELHFWRTQQKHEIDFIVGKEGEGAIAYEVKVNPAQFKKRVCEPFFKAYPEIPLFIVSLDSKEKTIGSRLIREVWEV